MKLRSGRGADVVVASVAVIGAGFGAAGLATLPMTTAPLTIRALVFMLVFAVVVLVGVPASEPFMRCAARRRATKAR